MASSHLARLAVAGAAVLGVVAVMAACDDGRGEIDGRGYGGHNREPQCTQVVQQCRQVCEYDCDEYQCYPVCGDECWNQCADGTDADASDSDATTLVTDGGPPSTTLDGSVSTDAGAGTGVLCTDCISNSDCESGALCILRGGPVRDASADDAGAPVGRGFCGHSCTTSDDCPAGFLCSQIGSSRQCLPTGNTCE